MIYRYYKYIGILRKTFKIINLRINLQSLFSFQCVSDGVLNLTFFILGEYLIVILNQTKIRSGWSPSYFI